MAYIETRVTAQDVLDDVARQLNYRINSLAASARDRKMHPSYMSARMLKDQILEVRGAAGIARSIMGGNLPDSINEKLREAYEAAQNALG